MAGGPPQLEYLFLDTLSGSESILYIHVYEQLVLASCYTSSVRLTSVPLVLLAISVLLQHQVLIRVTGIVVCDF